MTPKQTAVIEAARNGRARFIEIPINAHRKHRSAEDAEADHRALLQCLVDARREMEA